jgi:hypothetical protein
MMKKKAKKSKAGKKQSKRKGAAQRVSKDLNTAEVRKQVRKIIEEHATKMTEAVAGEGEKGQVGPVKYLFEVAHIHPPVTDGSEATEREQSLAETLLDRLGIPKDPVPADEDEKEETMTIPANLVRDAEPVASEAEAEEKEEAVTA